MTETGRDIAIADRAISFFERALDPRSDSCIRVPIIETDGVRSRTVLPRRLDPASD
jgi:hypothetical protein